jgi:acyl carrier protein
MSNPASSSDPLERARTILAGYPAHTREAAEAFVQSRSPEALDRLVLGVLTYHLPPDPARPALETLPGSTPLVAELGLDSLTVVEMTFVLEDVLAIKIADDELRMLNTLDELRQLLRTRLGVASA